MSTNDHDEDAIHSKKEAVKGFRSDWREVFVISRCYEMGDPLAPDPKGRENSGGGRFHPSVTP